MYAIRIIVLDGKDIQFIITKVGKPNSIYSLRCGRIEWIISPL